MLPLNIRCAIGEIIPVLRGWGGKVERPYRMAELILKNQPQTVVEIGVFGGQSFIPQAMALKALDWVPELTVGRGHIYGIDPFNLDVIKKEMAELDDEPMWLKQDMNLVREDTLRWIRDLELSNYAVLIIGESKDCSKLFQSIDILHIDGAHTEEAALMDVNLYAKRVRKGGYIWMDDTHFPSLQPALRELENVADIVEDWGGYRLYQHR